MKYFEKYIFIVRAILFSLSTIVVLYFISGSQEQLAVPGLYDKTTSFMRWFHLLKSRNCCSQCIASNCKYSQVFM